MKILVATDNYYPNVNGSSYFTQRLSHYLQERGHDVLVFAPSLNAKTEKTTIQGVNVFGITSVPLLVYKGFRWSLPFLAFRQMRKMVEEFEPDVIHIQDHFFICSMLQRIANKKHIPIIGTNHFMPENLVHYLHLPEKGEKAVANLGWRHFRSIYEKLNLVTTPTEAAANLLRNIGFSLPVLAVSCGIDRKIFNPEIDGSEIKKRYNVPAVPTFLYVGRLDKEKNVDLLLRAFAEASATNPAHFVIAGKGAETENLRSLVNELRIKEKVTFTGYVDDKDLPALYHIADCFVIAGIAELQSLVTMEAMASGLPVIAVNAVALPELVHHGQNGFLFEIEDFNGLTTSMNKILSSEELRKTMSQRSLQVIEKHDIKNTMVRYEKLYGELINNRPKKRTQTSSEVLGVR